MRAEGRAIAVGAYGVYMLSNDYGATWAEHKLEPTKSRSARHAAAAGERAKAGSAAGADPAT